MSHLFMMEINLEGLAPDFQVFLKIIIQIFTLNLLVVTKELEEVKINICYYLYILILINNNI